MSDENFQKISDEKDEQQIFIAVEKYLSLMIIELKEHIGKYKLYYENVLNEFKLDVWKYEGVLSCF